MAAGNASGALAWLLLCKPGLRINLWGRNFSFEENVVALTHFDGLARRKLKITISSRKVHGWRQTNKLHCCKSNSFNQYFYLCNFCRKAGILYAPPCTLCSHLGWLIFYICDVQWNLNITCVTDVQLKANCMSVGSASTHVSFILISENVFCSGR